MKGTQDIGHGTRDGHRTMEGDKGQRIQDIGLDIGQGKRDTRKQTVEFGEISDEI